MIQPCSDSDTPRIYSIVNDAATAYRGAIPADRWHEPYMPLDELRREIADGVKFWGWYQPDGTLTGVMGIQDMKDVALIRHAYVSTTQQRSGIGGQLLRHLLALTERPVLIGTWAAATWAISFYLRNGFTLVTDAEKNVLLRRYWNVPARQIETSVVLVDAKWRARTA